MPGLPGDNRAAPAIDGLHSVHPPEVVRDCLAAEGQPITKVKIEHVWFCEECDIAWTKPPGSAREPSCHGYVSGWFESTDEIAPPF